MAGIAAPHAEGNATKGALRHISAAREAIPTEGGRARS